MKKLAIVGAGDLGQLIAYHAHEDGQFNVVAFFDDFAKKDSFINNIPVKGTIQDITHFYEQGFFDCIIIGIGYKHLAFRETLFEKLALTIEFASVIHSSCYIDKSAVIGKGVFMLPGSVIDYNVKINDNVVINVSCTIAHDSEIKSHSFLSPAVAVAGFVTIGKRCNIGINSTIINNISITDDVQTGGGTVIKESIHQKGLHVGNPSRFIR